MSQEQSYAVCVKLLDAFPPGAEALDTIAGQPESHWINRMERVILVYGGKLTRKDKRMLLANFATADAASLAACEMQRRCLRIPMLVSRPLSLHIGIHRVARPYLRRVTLSGSGERRDPDRRFGFGIAISLAEEAAADGILLSSLTFRTLMAEIRKGCRPRGGPAAGTPIYELDWNRILSQQTRVSLFAAPPSLSEKQLALRIGASRLVLSHLNTATTFGRDPACDVIISDKLVSREHAYIEIRPEGCVLTDHSTNGTSIVLHGGHKIWVRNERFLLEERGRIGFGQFPGKGGVGILEFQVRNVLNTRKDEAPYHAETLMMEE
ncbi:MAG: FHA domain-containing protein [Candidatus Accumulibacter sp.]|jgi:hypothetical protein|nr:FHA domain-containing protein [Accumulibacter sp.]